MTTPITKRDWWIGVVLVVLVVLSHAMFPRYEWRERGATLIRIDRWTGGAVVGRIQRLGSDRQGEWVPLADERPISRSGPQQ